MDGDKIDGCFLYGLAIIWIFMGFGIKLVFLYKHRFRLIKSTADTVFNIIISQSLFNRFLSFTIADISGNRVPSVDCE